MPCKRERKQLDCKERSEKALSLSFTPFTDLGTRAQDLTAARLGETASGGDFVEENSLLQTVWHLLGQEVIDSLVLRLGPSP